MWIYETHRFEVAEAYAAFQGTDRQFRRHFEATFLRNGEHVGAVPSRRLPASIAERYLLNLKARVESRGPQTDVDIKALAHIYGKEVDILAGNIILKYGALDRLKNTVDNEALQGLTTDITDSIDVAITAEHVRSSLQSAADRVEFASDAPVLAPDAELEQINRYRTQYERQRSRLLKELGIVRRLKEGDNH